jgi:hypothetical protein
MVGPEGPAALGTVIRVARVVVMLVVGAKTEAETLGAGLRAVRAAALAVVRRVGAGLPAVRAAALAAVRRVGAGRPAAVAELRVAAAR